MTHRDELERLQAAARIRGWTVTFFFSVEGWIDQVYVFKAGVRTPWMADPLSAAEYLRPICARY